MEDQVIRLPFDRASMLSSFERLREARPICQVMLPSGDSVWLVTRYEDVKSVHSDKRFARNLLAIPGSPRSVPSGDWSNNPGSMINLDGAEHTRRRRPMAEHLTVRRVEQLRAGTEELVDRLLKQMASQAKPVDFMEAVAIPFPALATCKIIGIPEDDHRFFHGDWWPLAEPELYSAEQYADASARSAAYITELIAERRQAPCDDVLTALVRASDSGLLTVYEVIVSVYELVFGALVNIKSILAQGLLLLFEHPAHYQSLAREPQLGPMFVEEILRLHPHPLTGLLRVALEDVELNGVRIAKGEGVLTAIVAANRDPSAFERPGCFMAGQRATPHLSFGRGSHHCIGVSLARMFLGVVFPAVALRFPALQLAVGKDELRWHNSFHEYCPVAMPVTW